MTVVFVNLWNWLTGVIRQQKNWEGTILPGKSRIGMVDILYLYIYTLYLIYNQQDDLKLISHQKRSFNFTDGDFRGQSPPMS